MSILEYSVSLPTPLLNNHHICHHPYNPLESNRGRVDQRVADPLWNLYRKHPDCPNDIRYLRLYLASRLYVKLPPVLDVE